MINKKLVESGVLPAFRTDDVQHLISASRAIGAAGIGCPANGLDAEAYRTGCVEKITCAAKQWVDAVRRARAKTAATRGER